MVYKTTLSVYKRQFTLYPANIGGPRCFLALLNYECTLGPALTDPDRPRPAPILAAAYCPDRVARLETSQKMLQRQYPEILRGNSMQGLVFLDAQGDVRPEDIKPLRKDVNSNNLQQPVVSGSAPL